MCWHSSGKRGRDVSPLFSQSHPSMGSRLRITVVAADKSGAFPFPSELLVLVLSARQAVPGFRPNMQSLLAGQNDTT